MSSTRHCRHCKAPMAAGARGTFCCLGCEAASETIRCMQSNADQAMQYTGKQANSGDNAIARSESIDLTAPSQFTAMPRLHGKQSIIWQVRGMSCASCAKRINDGLEKVDGVLMANANAPTKTVAVEYDPQKTQPKALQQRVTELGYEAVSDSLQSLDERVATLTPQGDIRFASDASSIVDDSTAPKISCESVIDEQAQLLPELPPQTAKQTADHEAKLHRRAAIARIFVAGIGAMQSMMFMDALYWAGEGGMDASTRDFYRWLAFFFATPVVFYSAQPFFIGAWKQLKAKHMGMDLLVALSVGLAYIVSVIELVRGGVAVYFDAAVMFVFFLSVSRWLEESWRQKAHAAIARLANAVPQEAMRESSDGMVKTPIGRLQTNDVLAVAPHTPVPADGILLSDAGEFDEALLTGESHPVAKKLGDIILGGSINGTHAVRIRLTNRAHDSVLAQIQRLSQRALLQKPARLLVADQIAGIFTPAILLLTVAAALFWWWLDAALAIPVALSVLAISCPCALALATPTALAAAYAALAKRGILVLNGNALEALTHVQSLVFDKTGTLTTGKLQLKAVRSLNGWTESEARDCAAALANQGTHPVAKALQAETSMIASDLTQTPGQGIRASILDQVVLLGNAVFCGIDSKAFSLSTAFQAETGPSVWLRRIGGIHNKDAIAQFEFTDQLRPHAKTSVSSLQKSGLQVKLASGDQQASVRDVANELGITEFRAAIQPTEKLAWIQSLQALNNRVVMVGDGINDAPVLAAADVSMSFAQGASIAHQVSDFVIVADGLDRVETCIQMAHRARRVERQNLTWAVLYNALAIPAALTGFVSPWAAALGMSISSLVVTLNSLRLLRLPKINFDTTTSAIDNIPERFFSDSKSETMPYDVMTRSDPSRHAATNPIPTEVKS